MFAPHQAYFPLKHTENTVENHNQSKCKDVDPSPSGYIYKTILHLRLRTLRKRDRMTVGTRAISARLYLLLISEAISIKFHLHSCSNVNRTWMLSIVVAIFVCQLDYIWNELQYRNGEPTYETYFALYGVSGYWVWESHQYWEHHHQS